MGTHSSIPVRIIPRTEKPGGLQSMGSQRVGHVLALDMLDMLDMSSNNNMIEISGLGVCVYPICPKLFAKLFPLSILFNIHNNPMGKI